MIVLRTYITEIPEIRPISGLKNPGQQTLPGILTMPLPIFWVRRIRSLFHIRARVRHGGFRSDSGMPWAGGRYVAGSYIYAILFNAAPFVRFILKTMAINSSLIRIIPTSNGLSTRPANSWETVSKVPICHCLLGRVDSEPFPCDTDILQVIGFCVACVFGGATLLYVRIRFPWSNPATTTSFQRLHLTNRFLGIWEISF